MWAIAGELGSTLIAGALLVCRRRDSSPAEMPFCIAGYPGVTHVLIAASGFVVFSSIYSNPTNCHGEFAAYGLGHSDLSVLETRGG